MRGNLFVVNGGLILLALLSIAADCSPTRRACKHEGTPACDDGVGGTEYPACINFCAPRLTVNEALGADCSSDPCEAVELGLVMCPTGTHCEAPINQTVGQCVEAIGVLEACSPESLVTNTNGCSSGTYCRGIECPRVPKFDWLEDAEGVCVPPVREGELCDGNWGGIGCLLCEPGTECVGDPARNNVRVCQRQCEEDDDCPCGTPQTGETGTVEYGCQPHGYCAICHPNGTECRNPNDPELYDSCMDDPTKEGCEAIVKDGVYPCCDPASLCTEVDLEALGVGYTSEVQVCCRGLGSECGAGDDCCPGSDCIDGACSPCVMPGEFHEYGPDENHCCGADLGVAPNEDSVCAQPCEDKGEVCEECGDGVAYWECDPVQGAVCDRTALREAYATEEVCDDKDNDCDGRTDEGLARTALSNAPADCTLEEVPEECLQDGQANFSGIDEITGVLVCRRGESECVARPGVDYCAVSGPGASSSICQGFAGVPCHPADSGECGPGHVCLPSMGVGCANPHLPCNICRRLDCGLCWAPGDEPHSCDPQG